MVSIFYDEATIIYTTSRLTWHIWRRFKDVVNDTKYPYKKHRNHQRCFDLCVILIPQQFTSKTAIDVKYNDVFGNVWYIIPTRAGHSFQDNKECLRLPV